MQHYPIKSTTKEVERCYDCDPDVSTKKENEKKKAVGGGGGISYASYWGAL